MLEECKLCLEQKELKQSHILPSFAGKWLKNNSLTEYFRGIENPNLRKQDLTKLALLCGECENRFSVLENQAAPKLFKQWNENRTINLEYDDWLMKFVVSLSWRTAHMCKDEVSDLNLGNNITAKFDQALECWRRFLLGKRRDTGQYEHHIFLWAPVKSTEGMDDLGKWHAFTLRGFDGACLSYKQNLVVFTQLPGMSFFSSITPRHLDECRNTWITNQGVLTSPQTGLSIVNEWVLKRSKQIAELKLSSSQEQKLSEDVLKALAAETDDIMLCRKTQAIMEDTKWNS